MNVINFEHNFLKEEQYAIFENALDNLYYGYTFEQCFSEYEVLGDNRKMAEKMWKLAKNILCAEEDKNGEPVFEVYRQATEQEKKIYGFNQATNFFPAEWCLYKNGEKKQSIKRGKYVWYTY